MSEILSLNGDSKIVLSTLFDVISDTSTNPYYHISEIVQNELDAEADDISIKFIRRGGLKQGEIRKIIIEGNGFGFLESFEHYGQHMCDSIKKKTIEYRDRKDKGKSRGEFCLGLQGFRALSKEIQIINQTKGGKTPKTTEGESLDDPYFTKMFKNRKMVLHDNSIKFEIKEEEEFEDVRDSHGVTCILIEPKVPIKSDKLVKYLSQNKRNELIANENIKIYIEDYSYKKVVKPAQPSGEKFVKVQKHPKENKSHKFRGLGKVKATLYFHEEKPGSMISLLVKNEPIINDITKLPELDMSPWNSDYIDGYIEYNLLEKSPMRGGVKRDEAFFPGFIDMMEELSKEISIKIKDYETKTKTKQDKALTKKLNQVFGDAKRFLDLHTWFSKPIDKTQIGPLDYIKVFPEITNVPALTTRRLHVRAYDTNNKVLKESNNIEFNWNIIGPFGKILPKKDGEAIFKASSQIGPTSVEVIVKDLSTDNELSEKIQIAITHPPTIGKLVRVRIEPPVSTINLGEEREFKAIAEDEERNEIVKNVKFTWNILIDETNGAEFNIDYGESGILRTGQNVGTIKVR